jgi:DNA-binding transcriptional LysR family regulator
MVTAMARSFGYKNIELRQLRSFCLAATQENFTSAAETLGLSVPTVWEQVRALERKLRARLLTRRGRSVELTSEGRLLLRLIQPHVNSLDSVERLFESQRAELPQQLTVASTDYFFAYHLMQPIREFTQVHPSARLNLQVGLWSGDVSRPVERGEADLGILTYSRDEPRSAFLEYHDLSELPLLLLTAAQHPLARKHRVSLGDVLGFPLVTAPPQTLTQRALERLLCRHNLLDRLQPVMATGSVDLTLKYVAGGIGVALRHMSMAVARAQPGLHVRVFAAEPDAIPAAIVVRQGAYLPKLVQDFRDTVRHSFPHGSDAS